MKLINDIDPKTPLLIDAHLPYQYVEALELLNVNDRPIIKLQRNKSYIVKNLYYPSQLSVLRDNYRSIDPLKDIAILPEAIRYVRNIILAACKIQGNNCYRKIYVSRQNAERRQLLNTGERENFLIKQGFEIVFPEKLSFQSQVQIFAQAEIIIGQSGAGMTNFIFSSESSKILMLTSDVPNKNFQAFNILSDALKLNLEFLFGKCPKLRSTYTVHSNFYVDIELIKKFLDNLNRGRGFNKIALNFIFTEY